MQEKIPVLVIVGPTGTGKSAVAEQIVERIPATIINGDAFQVYREIPIISAAPEHWEDKKLYGIKSVSEQCSFVEYVAAADRAIQEVWSAGKLPIVVGGSGLYIDALIHRPLTPPKVAPDIRERVLEMTKEQARDFLQLHDPSACLVIDMRNPRRVQRAIEIFLQTGNSITEFRTKQESPYEVIMVGWHVSSDELVRRITTRTDMMWTSGAVDEVKRLLEAGHTLDEPGMQAIGVSEIAAFLRGEVSEDEARGLMVTHTLQYAKRQKTWFKRYDMVWYTSFDDVWRSVHTLLPKNLAAY